jgi:hypothetical protein
MGVGWTRSQLREHETRVWFIRHDIEVELR